MGSSCSRVVVLWRQQTFSGVCKKSRRLGNCSLSPISTIQIDENGVIYVADRENGRIQRFDLTGKYLGEWNQYGKTFGLKLDKDAIWLTSIAGQRRIPRLV